MKYITIALLFWLVGCSPQPSTLLSDGAWSVSGMNVSNTFKTKGKSLSFGEYEVSRAKYKPTSGSEFQITSGFTFSNQKTKTGYTFTTKGNHREVLVKVSEKKKIESLGLSKNVLFPIPVDAEFVQVGQISAENYNWEYLIRDEDWFKTKRENEAGFLTDGSTLIKIKLARQRVVFYQADQSIGEIRLPLNRNFSVWLKEDLRPDTKLAVSAVAGAILLKIKDQR